MLSLRVVACMSGEVDENSEIRKSYVALVRPELLRTFVRSKAMAVLSKDFGHGDKADGEKSSEGEGASDTAAPSSDGECRVAVTVITVIFGVGPQLICWSCMGV